VKGFEPSEISIPVGMTVIWFNDDNGEFPEELKGIVIAYEGISRNFRNTGGGNVVCAYDSPI
jgi:plastocyanin